MSGLSRWSLKTWAAAANGSDADSMRAPFPSSPNRSLIASSTTSVAAAAMEIDTVWSAASSPSSLAGTRSAADHGGVVDVDHVEARPPPAAGLAIGAGNHREDAHRFGGAELAADSSGRELRSVDVEVERVRRPQDFAFEVIVHRD